MPRADEHLTKRETLPVTDADGRLLGSCTVRKYLRRAGQAYNQICLYDTGENLVAQIFGYRLHSRVTCGDQAENTPRIDSKDALVVARLALEHGLEPGHVLRAIQEIAEILAEERGAKRRRGREQMP
jgi:hypothetical protein